MNAYQLPDYLAHMAQAAREACGFVEGLTEAVFFEDRRTQNAVVMSLIVIGEAATKIMAQYPDFVDQHRNVPWRQMRGMRNRIAHGYFEVDFAMVWITVQTALPSLLAQLPDVIAAAQQTDK